MGTDTPLGRPEQPAPPAVQLLQADVRPGHQPPPSTPSVRRLSPSTSVYIGAHGNLLEGPARELQGAEGPTTPSSPRTDLLKIKKHERPGLQGGHRLHQLLQEHQPGKGHRPGCSWRWTRAYKEGANIIILSDRDIDEYHVAIPSLLAVSAVSQYLIRTKKSNRSGPDPGERRAPGGPPLRRPAGLWRPAPVNPYLAHEAIGPADRRRAC